MEKTKENQKRETKIRVSLPGIIRERKNDFLIVIRNDNLMVKT